MSEHTVFDWSRKARTGVPEVIFAQGKTLQHLLDILNEHRQRDEPLLMTRLTTEQISGLEEADLDIDTVARTAIFRSPPVPETAPLVGIVAAGTSDIPVAREALNSTTYLGLNTSLFVDVGVAGLWRLEKILPRLQETQIVIATAGMEGALFSVLAGLLPQAIIAVPTSVGYGVSADGRSALSSALASCAPGVVTVNIDNGFGAAAAARKLLLR